MELEPGSREFAAGATSATLTFIIPAFNEELLIPKTLQAIHEAVGSRLLYEIIVVDNGSSDSTVRIAEAQGAVVLTCLQGTIGTLRNVGARRATGDVLIFLDADVVLTTDWSTSFQSTIRLLQREPRVLTGSMCSIPHDASWIERFWFGNRNSNSLNHVGTGHMIATRTFFQQLGGFDETLVTGEDYDLSRRAKLHGGQIVLDEKLRVEHLGFPRTVAMFLKREMWHGAGDFRSIGVFFHSKVAIAAACFAMLHIVIVVSLASGRLVPAVSAAAGLGAMCLGSSVVRYRGRPVPVILINSVVYYVYYSGRALAAFRAHA